MNWHFQMDHDEERNEGEMQADFLSVQHYLLYWKVDPEIREHIANHLTTTYAASNYLKRVKPGDVLWIINVHHYQLYLLGRLKVEFVVDDTQIAQDLVDTDSDQWEESDWYAISNKYAIEPMRSVNISHLAHELRFVSPVSEMLDLHNGQIDAQQLRMLRLLTIESAQLLDDVWYNDAYTPQTVQDFLELSEDDRAYNEGKVVIRTIQQRQRSRQLVNDAKVQFRSRNEGRLYCEVCGFDFSEVYGIDYIEVHHTKPLSELNQDTENTLDSVVLICANCHRAAHSRTPPYSIDELRKMIN